MLASLAAKPKLKYASPVTPCRQEDDINRDDEQEMAEP